MKFVFRIPKCVDSQRGRLETYILLYVIKRIATIDITSLIVELTFDLINRENAYFK